MNRSAVPLRFACGFLFAFAALMGGFEATRGSAFERLVIEGGFLQPTAHIINVVTPGDPVRVIGRTLKTAAGASLRVTRGCEGIETLLLLVAAILAFPSRWHERWRGLAIGVSLAYATSIARLLALHYTLRYDAAAWEALHGLILPLTPALIITVYFLHWAETSNSAPRVDAATARG